MCGIAGVHHAGKAGEDWQEHVHNMVRHMVHRGPDDEGYYSDDDVTMGIRRLQVIDLETGAQPVCNETGSIQVVGNAEIYRYESIRKILQDKGHVFKTKGDIEVIAHLYEEYELGFLDHIDGMYAIVLWDRDRKRLIVARDRFGIKPLFYTIPSDSDCFAFASEIGALLLYPGLSKELDSFGIDRFFTFSYIPHPHTAYKNIRKLPPGSYLVAEKGRFDCRPYWDLPHSVSTLSPRDALEALDCAISDAVRTMMRADVPIGAFLSGGLDSATVVYHMSRMKTQPVRTFSVRLHEESFDEGRQIADIVKALGTEHKEIWCYPDDVRYAARLQSFFGEPFADPSQIPTFIVSKLAKEDVVVALSGDGGDELFGGYPTYLASLLADKTRRLPKSFISLFRTMADSLPSSSGHAGVEYKLQKFLRGCHLPPVARHAMWRTIFSGVQREKLYTRDFDARLENESKIRPFQEWEEMVAQSDDDHLRGYQYLDIKTYLTDNNLAKWDRMSMANSLEVRVPLLDLEVFNVSMRVPSRLRINRLQTKTVLRKLMKQRLPESVTEMGKKGFTIPLNAWFRKDLKEYVHEVLSTDRLQATGVIAPEFVREIVNGHMSRRFNYSRQLWNLITFVHWYEQQAQR